MQVDGRVSYGNDALMPDQTYSSAPMDPGLDGFGFIHPESFNQANTENHGNTHSLTQCHTLTLAHTHTLDNSFIEDHITFLFLFEIVQN